MKVYLLMRSYSDGSDSWESVEEIYKSSEDAEQESARLNEMFSKENSPYNNTCFYVQARNVL